MRVDPVATVRSFGIALAFVAGLASYAGSAAGALSNFCSTHSGDRITTCFLDLRKTPETQFTTLNGGIFVGTSGELGTGGTGQQPSVSTQQGVGIQSGNQLLSDTIVPLPTGTIRLGDIPKVTVCDARSSRDERSRTCARFFEFVLDGNDGASGKAFLDEFKVLASSGGDTQPELRFDMDGGPGGDAAVLYIDPDGSGYLQALVPASSFAGLTDDSFVYVFSTFRRTGKCQEGTQNSSCPAPPSTTGFAEGAAVPLPSTALLLGIGLVGMFGIRRRRSPDSSVSR